MTIQMSDLVMLPGYAPYPRYGRVVQFVDGDRVRVANVQCGDPRCLAEHQHGEQVWHIAEIRAAPAYQPRAPWEHGRLSSPNAAVP